MAIGDSMSQGIGASAPERGLVGQVAEHLAAAGRPHRVVNLSVTGARVQDAIDHQLPALHDLVAIGPVPALLTVVIGSNDVVSPRLRAGLHRTVHQPPRRPPRRARWSPTCPTRTARRGGSCPAPGARACGTLVVADMHRQGPRSWRGKLAADKFHPNDAGYAAMARVFDLALGLEVGA